MPAPPNFTEQEWDDLCERRRDHLRRSVSATRNATGYRNERERLARQLSKLDEGSENDPAAMMPDYSDERAVLQEQYTEACHGVDIAEGEVRALTRIAADIEMDMNGSVGTVGLLLPIFSE